MKMKKTISFILAVLLVLSLCACGNTASSSDAASEPASEAASAEPVSPAEEPAAEEETVLSIKDVFAAHGLKFGSCLSPAMIQAGTYEEILTSQFSSITLENYMKPEYILDQKKSIETGDVVVKFDSTTTELLDWAQKNNMAVRGHTLVWHDQTPEWLFHVDFDESKDYADRDTMLARLESYIKQVFDILEEKGYSDMFYAYDVVNEAWMETGSLRKTNWYNTIGKDYLRYAFYYADKYAPDNIKLFYNDYNENLKVAPLLKFVKTLVDDEGNSLIDGIGLQAHLYMSEDIDKYLSSIDVLAKTGLILEITELDICLGSFDNPVKNAADDDYKAQGRVYYNLINGLLERVDAGTLNMDSLTVWGFTDGLSWRKESKPCIYSDMLEPKYAYYGIAQMKDQAGFDD